MRKDIQKQWEDFLNPELTRSQLISAAIFIAGFEMLKVSIIDRIRDFYWDGFHEKEDIISPEYVSKVVSRNKSRLYASLAWLEEIEAIDSVDLQSFERIKRCRNQLAHNLFTLLANDGLPQSLQQCFNEMVALHQKIEIWWIVNVELAINPDYDAQTIEESDIIPGPVMILQLFQEIALGSDEKSQFYYREFKKRFGGKDK